LKEIEMRLDSGLLVACVLGMLLCGLRLVPAPGLITPEEAEAATVTGGACGSFRLANYNYCGLWGGGIKFWEFCPEIGTLEAGSTWNLHAQIYNCTTSCGYNCGSYLSGTSHCGS
jgi:hypothetical protein